MKIKESVDQDEILRQEMEAFDIYRWEHQNDVSSIHIDWSPATADPGYAQWAARLDRHAKI